MSLSTIPDLFERTMGRLSVRDTYLVCAALLIAMAVFWLLVGHPVSAGLSLGVLLVLGLVYLSHRRRTRRTNEYHDAVIADLQRAIDNPMGEADRFPLD